MADTSQVGSQWLIDLIHRIAGTPTPLSSSLGLSTQDVPPPAVNNPNADVLNRLLGVPATTGRADIDVSSQTPLPPTPTMSPKTRGIKPPQDPGRIYINTTDKDGNPITLFSTTPNLHPVEDFGRALSYYNKNQSSPEGWLVLPTPSTQAGIRRGFENINQPLQQALPDIGATVGGGIASVLPLAGSIMTGGVISPTNAPTTTAGENVGRAVGNLAAQQINTPGKAGAAVGTALAAPFMGSAASVGILPKAIPMLRNALIGGTVGAAGYNIADIAGGGSFSPEKSMEEFALAGLGGGLSGLVGHFLTKFAKGDIGEKVANEMINSIIKKYPALLNNPRALDIAGTSNPQLIESLTAQMSKVLMGGTEEGARVLGDTIKGIIPRALSKGEQNTFRAHMRAITTAQTNQLDSIGDPRAFMSGGLKVKDAFDELTAWLTSKMPTIKTTASSSLQGTDLRELRIQSAITSQLDEFSQGARVLYYLRQSGAHEGWNPKRFADTIKGIYQDEPGSLLERMGKILGQGQSITSLPTAGQASPGEELTRKAYNFLADRVGLWGLLKASPMKGPSVPWGPGSQGLSIPAQTLQNFGASETGQTALRSWSESK